MQNSNKNNIEIKFKNNIPYIKINHKNKLNMKFIDYNNINYLCFINIVNDKIEIDKEIKQALNYNYEKFIFLYYDTLLKALLNTNIKNCFGNILDKYGIKQNKLFTVEHLKILREIYDKEGVTKEMIVYHQDILEFWKNYSFLKYDNKIHEYKPKRKIKNFLFEFNSKFWIEKYKQIIKTTTCYSTNSFSSCFKNMINELNKQLKKEKEYILIPT